MFIQVLKSACRIRLERCGATTIVEMRGSADLSSVDDLQTQLGKALAESL